MKVLALFIGIFSNFFNKQFKTKQNENEKYNCCCYDGYDDHYHNKSLSGTS